MQHIDNDMDDLFNKAGRDYPLKTDNGDWDAVFGKLQQPAPAPAPLTPTTNRRFYWLALLLLLPFAYFLADKKDDELKKEKEIETKQELKQGTTRQNLAVEKNITREPITTGQSANEQGIDEQGKDEQRIKVAQEKRGIAEKPIAENKPGVTTNQRPLNRQQPLPAVAGNPSPAAAANLPPAATGNPTPAAAGNPPPAAAGSLSPAGGSGAGGAEGGLRAQRANNDLKPTTPTFPRIPISHSLSPYSINPPPIKTPQSPGPQKPKHLKTSNLYAGLLFGPDLSTVKYQEIKNTGFSIGILAGYQFSRHWAVEAGVLYNKKKYFTDGKYFDKAGANIPASVTIDDMDGICEMFEIPISIRYNFSKKENTLFATAGVTSYFMNKEEYEYGAWTGGSWYQGYRSYDKSGNHIFSNVQFSVGYNYNISKKISLRIEPYIKIPVSDIGIGNLPITSTGLYFGVMRKFR